MRSVAGERSKMRMSLLREMVGSRELRVEWKEKASEMEAGEVPISAGTGAPVPWTGGAVLANIQPNPCSTTSSTHAETVFMTHPRHTATKPGLHRVQQQLKEKSGWIEPFHG